MHTVKKVARTQTPVHQRFEVRFVLSVHNLPSLPSVEWLTEKRDTAASLASTISTGGHRLVPGNVNTSAKVDLLCSLGQEVDCCNFVIANYGAITAALPLPGDK